MARSAVAEALREQDRAHALRLSPDERAALALALGREAEELYARAHGVSLAEARRELERAKHAGRRPSVAAE